MPKDFSQRIKKLRATLRLTQHALAERLRVRTQVVASWEQGRKQPSARNYQQLAKLAPPHQAWFFLGRIGVTRQLVRSKWSTLRAEGKRYPMQPPEIRIFTPDEWKRSGQDRLPFQVQIPVLREDAGGSPPLPITERDIDTFLVVPARSAPKGPGVYCAFHVRDDSMAPILRHGFIAVVDHSQRDPLLLRGRLVAARVEGGLLVRRLAPETRLDRLILRSENPLYQDIVLDSPQENPLIGDVVSWWGRPDTSSSPVPSIDLPGYN